MTGAMGGGKTAILSLLRSQGFRCIAEPAREILAEQRRIGAPGVPETNSELFTHLMLTRALHDFEANADTTQPVVFDRSLPDLVAYANLFGLEAPWLVRAAQEYRSNARVFYFPAWEEIYTNDTERKIGFAGAKAFGEDVRRVYETLGYELIEVPRVSPQERVEYLIAHLGR